MVPAAGRWPCRGYGRGASAVVGVRRRDDAAHRHDTLTSGLAFATGLALVTGLLFGAAPAWFATRTDPIEALRGSGRTAGDRASFARTALLVAQAALSVVLVAGSTMLGRSLGNLEGQDFGFEKDGRVLVSVGRPAPSFTDARLTALYRDLEERLSRLPGVQGVGLALYNPLTNNWGEGVLVAGKPLPAPGDQTGASWDRVSANYLQHRRQLVRGRFFTEADNETAENVAVGTSSEAFLQAGKIRLIGTSLNSPENVFFLHRGGGRPSHPASHRRGRCFRAARVDGELREPMMRRVEGRTTWAGCCW
jgi:hypothetical protein